MSVRGVQLLKTNKQKNCYKKQNNFTLQGNNLGVLSCKVVFVCVFLDQILIILHNTNNSKLSNFWYRGPQPDKNVNKATWSSTQYTYMINKCINYPIGA